MKQDRKCPMCDGTGSDKIDDKFYDPLTPCPKCHGSGKIFEKTYEPVEGE